MKKNNLFTKLTLLVVSVVLVALSATTVVIYHYVQSRERQQVEDKIATIADWVSSNDTIVQALDNQDKSGIIQQIAREMMDSTGVDFIVVMDLQFVRFSHPTESIIGGVFSNIEDARSTLTKGEHFSQLDGTLGAGIRYFKRMYNAQGEIIGIVCVGYRRTTVLEQLKFAFSQLVLAFVVGLAIAIMVAYFFTRRIKRTLLELEPEEISQLVLENQYVSEHISEGILAIDMERQIIFVNPQLMNLLKKACYKEPLTKGQTLSEACYHLFFATALETEKRVVNKRIPINHVDVVINSNPIYSNNKLYGAVATVRDESEMQQLITELSTTEKYNDSLRAQSHHFMNQMHVLQGLIELNHVEEADKYIRYLKRDYHRYLGHVSEVIKSPVLVGLLLGKIDEASKKDVQLLIDEETLVPNSAPESVYHDMTIILGVLVDNAIDAVQTQVDKTIQLFLMLSMEERVMQCIIEDTGIGIPQENQKKIFQRGFSTKGENRGYGLEAVQSIVEKYQGTISVDSQIGRGTRISIEWSLKEDEDEYTHH